ncbi:MAG: hypothetical protein ABGX16_13415 [Pirellulales bacterium]
MGEIYVVGSTTLQSGDHSGVVLKLTPTTPEVVVKPTSGLETTEDGGMAEFAIALSTQPTDTVTIDIASDNTEEGTVSTGSVLCTTDNWNTAQTVTVTGVGDSDQDGHTTYHAVLGPVTSTDSEYQGLDPVDVLITNFDTTLPVLSADFDFNGDADGFDFLLWQQGFGKTSGATRGDGDTDEDEDVDDLDLATWAHQFGMIAASADFDFDGDADGYDFLLWQQGFGITSGAMRGDGDSDEDGDVDDLDLAAWASQFSRIAAATETVAVEAASVAATPSTLVQARITPIAHGNGPFSAADLSDAALALTRYRISASEVESMAVQDPASKDRFFEIQLYPNGRRLGFRSMRFLTSEISIPDESEGFSTTEINEGAFDEVFDRSFQ